MRTILIALALVVALGGCTESHPDFSEVPNPRDHGSWVHDGASILGPRKDAIDAVIDAFERDTSIEITVVTVYSIGDRGPKDFATELFNHWGVGKADEDNGVLILHVLDQRRVEIETGYGVESVLTDARAKRIIDEVTIPFFKEDSFADGHYETVRAIVRCLRNEGSLDAITTQWDRQPGAETQAVIPPTPVGASPELRVETGPWPLGLLGIAGVWLLFMLVGIRRFAWVGRTHKLRAVPEYVVFGIGVVGLLANGLPVDTAFVIGAPAAWAIVFGLRRMVGRAEPYTPRVCSGCRANLGAALTEHEEDEHLTPGQQAEESIGSYDYDVWVCNCGRVHVERRDGWGEAVSCPACQRRAVTNTATVEREATVEEEGTMRISASCANCDFEEVSTRSLRKLQGGLSGFTIGTPVGGNHSSSGFSSSSGGFGGGSSGGSFGGGSSGGSSGGGSSRGSFGGGSSGGGGAGGSY